MKNQAKGILNENLAWNFFQKKEYQLIKKNFSFDGVELDLILKKEDVFYIVEVKSNNLWRLEHPLSFSQQTRLKKSALKWSETYQCATRLLLAIVQKNKKVQIFPLDSSPLPQNLQT